MKTFSTRELRQSTIKVFAAAERDGEVRVRRRNGAEFLLQPVVAAPTQAQDWRKFAREHRAWLKQTYPQPVVPHDMLEEVNRMIASDGRLL